MGAEEEKVQENEKLSPTQNPMSPAQFVAWKRRKVFFYYPTFLGFSLFQLKIFSFNVSFDAGKLIFNLISMNNINVIEDLMGVIQC